MKRFTVPCDFNGVKHPFHVYSPALNDGTKESNQYSRLKSEYIRLRDEVVSETEKKFALSLKNEIKEFKSQTDSFLDQIDGLHQNSKKVAGSLLEKSGAFNDIFTNTNRCLAAMAENIKTPDKRFIQNLNFLIKSSMKEYVEHEKGILNLTFSNVLIIADNANLLGNSAKYRGH